jgi:hypothetical protein
VGPLRPGVPSGQGPGQPDRRREPFLRPERLDPRLLPGLQAPQVAHVPALELQGGAPGRREAELASLRWAPVAAAGRAQRGCESAEGLRDRDERLPDDKNVPADRPTAGSPQADLRC